MRTLLLLALGCLTTLSQAEEALLEDFEGGGEYSATDWVNHESDADGNPNQAMVRDGKLKVVWTTKWSGLPSAGEPTDKSQFKSYQVDVMVPTGEPVEQECNFYFQLLNKVDQGYSYWETFVKQNKIPADGQWYRVTFPISGMSPQGGDGGDPPSDFRSIYGCACGMTYDESGSQFKSKEAYFDNIRVLTKEIDGIKVQRVKE